MKHSIHCVCKGTNVLEVVECEYVHNGTLIRGIKKITCVYDDLRVNQPVEAVPYDTEYDWEF